MTHLRSGASSGVEVELAALRGRVTMVEAEPVTARATHDQLAPEVEQLRRASKRQAAPFSKGMSCGTPDGQAASRAWSTAATHAARFPTLTRSAGPSTLDSRGLPALRRRAQRRADGLPVSTRPPAAAGDRDLPLRHPDRPLPAGVATAPGLGPRAGRSEWSASCRPVSSTPDPAPEAEAEALGEHDVLLLVIPPSASRPYRNALAGPSRPELQGQHASARRGPSAPVL